MTPTTAALAPALLLGGLATLAVGLSPDVPAASAQPVLRVVLDTVVALVALLLACLVYGRYQLSRRTGDLLLVLGLALAGVLNAAVAATASLDSDALTVLAWGPPAGRVAVATVILLAAWCPGERRTTHRCPLLLLVGVCLALSLLVVVGVVAAAELLPASAVPDLGARGPLLPTTGMTAWITGAGLLGSVLYAGAAAGFHARKDDPLAPTFAAASALLAVALLNHAFVPSLYPHWVYAGDLLRLAAYGVLLLGASGEVRRYWADQARLAVEEERRRVARTLHDGVAQEVSLLAGQLRLWALGRPALEPRLLAEAADRAVDESRAAIAALSGCLDEPLDRALLRMADDVEARLGVRVRTDVQAVPLLPRPERDALLRAAREAVLSVACQGGCEEVHVLLRGGDHVRLTVVAGSGLSAPVEAPGGSSLESLRGRLRAVGGRVVVTAPEAGRGTLVEVALPCRA